MKPYFSDQKLSQYYLDMNEWCRLNHVNFSNSLKAALVFRTMHNYQNATFRNESNSFPMKGLRYF